MQSRDGERATGRELILPLDGASLGIKLDGQTKFVWWGEDPDGLHDRVAGCGDVIVAFPTIEACRTVAESRGWPGADDADEAPAVLDVDPVVAWISHRRLAIDPVASLELWNVSGDIAWTIGKPWSDRGPSLNRCYDKLLIANVPWLGAPNGERVTWSPRELNRMRTVMTAGLGLVRAAMRTAVTPRAA